MRPQLTLRSVDFRSVRLCANKLRIQWERFLSARGSDLRSVLMWTSVWSGNLLSCEVISLTHCIVKWWGGPTPSSKNGVTWPRFVMAASAFCLLSSQKWSVLFSMFDLSPLHHVLNWQVFFTLILITATSVSYKKKWKLRYSMVQVVNMCESGF